MLETLDQAHELEKPIGVLSFDVQGRSFEVGTKVVVERLTNQIRWWKGIVFAVGSNESCKVIIGDGFISEMRRILKADHLSESSPVNFRPF